MHRHTPYTTNEENFRKFYSIHIRFGTHMPQTHTKQNNKNEIFRIRPKMRLLLQVVASYLGQYLINIMVAIVF